MPAAVDSSGWIEYFVDGPNADRFACAIENTGELLVPAITLTEVYRWMLREASESEALAAVAAMKQGNVLALDGQLSILAAEVSHRHKLPLADGIIYAAAKHHQAEWKIGWGTLAPLKKNMRGKQNILALFYCGVSSPERVF